MMSFRLPTALAFLSLALSAHATDAYSNFSPPPGQPFDPDVAYFVGSDVTTGFQFTTTAGGTLAGFTLPLNQLASDDRNFSLTLYADSGSDTLGASLGTYAGLTTGTTDGMSPGLVHVAANGPAVALASGSKYWLVASGVESFQLYWYASNAPGNSGYYVNGDYNPSFAPTPAGAFSVQVDSVPEPGALAALGLGAAAMRRRRKRA